MSYADDVMQMDLLEAAKAVLVEVEDHLMPEPGDEIHGSLATALAALRAAIDKAESAD